MILNVSQQNLILKEAEKKQKKKGKFKGNGGELWVNRPKRN